MTSYSLLAEFYDGLMDDFPYDRYVAFVLQHAVSGRGLDLFCGSGRITIALSKAGFAMKGSDISSEMLNVAMNNAAAQGEKIIFCRERAEEFAYLSKLDLITAVCDGVNYLTYNRALKLFLRVKRALSPTGVFVFDVSSRYKLTKILADNTFFYDGKDLTYIWRGALTKSNRAINFDIAFFVKRGAVYERCDERHRLYIHGVPELRRALRDAGLSIIEIVDGETFKAVSAKSKRVVFAVKHA